MTPKEKARELIDSHLNLFKHKDAQVKLFCAKLYSESWVDIMGRQFGTANTDSNPDEYWDEVIKEIQKL